MNHQSIRRLLVSNKVGGMWKFWDERRIKGGAPLVVSSAGRPLEDGSSEPKSTTAFPQFPISLLLLLLLCYYSSVILLSFLSATKRNHSFYQYCKLITAGWDWNASLSIRSFSRSGDAKNKIPQSFAAIQKLFKYEMWPHRSAIDDGIWCGALTSQLPFPESPCLQPVRFDTHLLKLSSGPTNITK